VLREEALATLRLRAGGVYVDATFGAGGYTRAMLQAADCRVIAFDRDPGARAFAAPLMAQYPDRLTLIEAPFSRMDTEVRALGPSMVDGVVLDIGVSSMQLDEAERGFSFRQDGPLDMRMGAGGPSAADLVNRESEARLADIFYYFGEERFARVIARAIVTARQASPITTTRQLADLIAGCIRVRPQDIHPATRSFQALRIAVNDELGELASALHAAERLLAPDGVLSVVTFHSLEDRIVKTFFNARSGRTQGGSRHQPVLVEPKPTFRIDGKWPISPSHAELVANPRARSAKLRAGIRTSLEATAADTSVMALAALPEPKRGRR
jgi:16S rRNA (cytosine1402-N4)-methyltransferase